jgi:hypothetical protein
MPSTRSLMLATAQRCELISELLGLPRSFDRQFVRNVLERFSPQQWIVRPMALPQPCR